MNSRKKVPVSVVMSIPPSVCVSVLCVSICPSVRVSACIRLTSTGSISRKFDIGVIYGLFHKNPNLVKTRKNVGHLTGITKNILLLSVGHTNSPEKHHHTALSNFYYLQKYAGNALLPWIATVVTPTRHSVTLYVHYNIYLVFISPKYDSFIM